MAAGNSCPGEENGEEEALVDPIGKRAQGTSENAPSRCCAVGNLRLRKN